MSIRNVKIWQDVDDEDNCHDDGYKNMDYYDPYYEGGDEKKDANEVQKAKYKKDLEEMESGLTKDGIERNRSCTDLYCLVIFWLHIALMIYMMIYGSKHGQFEKLLAPLDAANNFCGFEDMKGYPNLLLTDFSSIKNPVSILGTGVCVKECPINMKKDFVDGTDCKDNAKVKCSAAHASKTVDFLGICVPVNKNALNTEEEKAGYAALMQFIKSNTGALQDMKKSSTAMYASLATALLWSFLYIYIMSCFAEQLAWCCIFLVQFGLIAAAVGCYMLWDQAKTQLEETKKQEDYASKSDEYKKQVESGPTMYFWMMVGAGILALVFFCLLCCFKDSLRTAIDVIDASADYIAHNKRVILVPNLHFLFTIIVVILWLVAFLYVISLNEIKPGLIPQSKDIIWKEKKYKFWVLYMIFGFFWLTAFIEYSSRVVVITGAVTYYFNNSRDKPNEENGADIMFGFKCAYYYHAGSVAFGSFIIAVVRFIKFMFYYLAKKIQKSSGNNKMIEYAVLCAGCILNCIERVCDYINESAYCYQAVTGQSFCKAALNGFLMNLKNGAQFLFANIIAKMFILLGKIGIVVANVVTLYYIMQFRGDLDEVGSVKGPVIAIAVFTFLAASLFLSLFEEAVMALSTCICCDREMNGEALFGPATFHDKYLASFKDGKPPKQKNNEVE